MMYGVVVAVCPDCLGVYGDLGVELANGIRLVGIRHSPTCPVLTTTVRQLRRVGTVEELRKRLQERL